MRVKPFLIILLPRLVIVMVIQSRAKVNTVVNSRNIPFKEAVVVASFGPHLRASVSSVVAISISADIWVCGAVVLFAREFDTVTITIRHSLV